MRRLSVAVVLLSLAQAGLLLAQSSNQQPYVMRQDVHRVLVDVVVTDKDGKPIRGLKPGDFTVREDKKPQQVLSFEFADGSKFNYLPPKLPTLPPNTYVSLPSGPSGDRSTCFTTTW